MSIGFDTPVSIGVQFPATFWVVEPFVQRVHGRASRAPRSAPWLTRRRRLLGQPPKRILFTQSTSLRWTWTPDEPLLIDSFADVAPEPSGCVTRGRRT